MYILYATHWLVVKIWRTLYTICLSFCLNVYFYIKPAIWLLGYRALCMYFMRVYFIYHFCGCQATNILMTFWMIWPQPGQGAWHLCSLRAQGKQVSMCAVRPWMMLPSRGRTRHSLQGSSMTSRPSWLSWELWSTRRGALPLADTGEAGKLRDTQCEGRMTGSETVRGQSGTSMPSSSSSSLWSGRSETETECARCVQSLYQSLRSAQQCMQ